MATAWSLLLDYGTLNTYLGAFRVGVKDRSGKNYLQNSFLLLFEVSRPQKDCIISRGCHIARLFYRFKSNLCLQG